MVDLNEKVEVRPAQKRYASWLAWGTRAGLVMLVLAFGAYLAGLAPHIPIEHLPAAWERSSADLLRRSGLEPGWSWAGLAHRGDFLVVAAIAVLASWSIACLAAVLPVFRSRGETVLAIVCALQIGVLALAASGILSVAH